MGEEITSWHSYPSIFALGHRALAELFAEPVLVEEKVDGSQFSFGVINGELRVRSKGQQMIVEAPEKMFSKAVATAVALADRLKPDWTYRGEYLQKPHHNALAYDRVPSGYVILFDINTAQETYLPYNEKVEEAQRLGLEVVPRLYEGMVETAEQFRAFLTNISILGGQHIEGCVIKNYTRFGPDKKALMGKFVSEAYKEVHAREWKISNPNNGDIIDNLIQAYRTPARWAKAVQHIREAGGLESSPRDIGKLIKEVPDDVLKECRDELIEALMAWAWPKIRRGITHGLPEWYKQLLLDSQFEPKAEH